MKDYVLYTLLYLILAAGYSNSAFAEDRIPETVQRIISLLGINPSEYSQEEIESKINARGIKEESGYITKLNQKCYISFDEDLRHIFIDGDNLLASRKNLPKTYESRDKIKEIVDGLFRVISQGQPERFASPIIDQGTGCVNLSYDDVVAIPTWRIFIPRIIHEKFIYETDGIYICLTGDGVPFYIAMGVTSNHPPSLDVKISKKEAISSAAALLDDSFRKIRPDVMKRTDIVPEFDLSSAELRVKNKDLTLNPKTMNCLSESRFETLLLWRIVYNAKEHTYFPDNPNKILLQKGYELVFEFDPVTGEWIGLDCTL